MRYTGPKGKKARRLGQAFTPKEAKVLQRRPTAPGQHGQSRSRVSEYGMQLKEKQKAKFAYGVLERQFLRYFNKALKRPGVTGDNLLKLLEMRLDNVVYRLGFAASRAHARQLVSHGFFTVNGKNVNIPSYAVKVGDAIQVKESKQKSKFMQTVKDHLKAAASAEWLESDSQKMSAKVLSEPSLEQIGEQIQTQLIVEHYSRI